MHLGGHLATYGMRVDEALRLIAAQTSSSTDRAPAMLLERAVASNMTVEELAAAVLRGSIRFHPELSDRSRAG